ncbi:MAG: hypothetical protein Q8R97_07995 [Brevundimonas sp.]|nr:hypothetical protein [Brevundimonas sp.]
MIGVGVSLFAAALRGSGGSAPATYTITAGAGANGSISPSGAVSVAAGGNQQFAFSANSGYAVESVTVDGVPVATTSPYTFTNVTANHTIAVAFRLKVSAVRQTLYPASGRVAAIEVFAGTPRSWTSQTPAEAHDGRDETFDRGGIEGDGVDPGNAQLRVVWALDTCTYAGVIDKVRVRPRGAVQGAGNDGSNFQAYYNGSPAGTGVAAGGTLAWYEWDYATKPGGGAWTAAAINALTDWGWLANLQTVDEATYVDALVSEFEVQVWGTE